MFRTILRVIYAVGQSVLLVQCIKSLITGQPEDKILIVLFWAVGLTYSIKIDLMYFPVLRPMFVLGLALGVLTLPKDILTEELLSGLSALTITLSILCMIYASRLIRSVSSW